MRHLQALTVGALRMAALAIGLAVSWVESGNTLKYDTAWTFVYDGGRSSDGKAIWDGFSEIKVLPNGVALCVGATSDSVTPYGYSLLVKLSSTGKMLQTGRYGQFGGVRGSSLLLDDNGDILVGGARFEAPLLLRYDSSLTLKTTSFYYDTVRNRALLGKGGTLNSLYKTPHGRIISLVGDDFPDNLGQDLQNYAAFLEFDAVGTVKRVKEWLSPTGYSLSGWSLASDGFGGLLLGGNEAVLSVDTQSVLHDEREYTFSLTGVGTVNNRVLRNLRDGRRLAIGQAYEEDCWTRWKRLSYDGWWTPLSGTGRAEARYTAGVSGYDDILYDAAQLVDGRIVLIGKKETLDNVGGIWALVTDSTSKNILWEGRIPIPYRGDKGASATGYSVAATPDSGFTVVGTLYLADSLGARNSFAAHIIPKVVPTAVRPPQDLRRIHSKDPWTIAFQSNHPGKVALCIYNVRGKRTARYSQWMSVGGKGEFRLEKSTLGDGISFWRLQMDGRAEQGIYSGVGTLRRNE